MERLGESRTYLAALAAWAALAGPVLGAAAQTAAPPIRRIRIANGRTGGYVQRAVADARARLAEPACHGLLAEFKDGQGRPLQDSLDALQRTPEEHLDSLFFYDGSGTPACRADVAAATNPGSHVVLICADRFVRSRWPDGEVTIVHEMLHTLGLGENPPTSLEINRRVRMRCFDHAAQRSPETR